MHPPEEESAVSTRARAAAILCALVLAAMLFRWESLPGGIAVDRWTGVAWRGDDPAGIAPPEEPRPRPVYQGDPPVISGYEEPSAQEIAAFQQDLDAHRRRVAALRNQRDALTYASWAALIAALIWLLASLRRARRQQVLGRQVGSRQADGEAEQNQGPVY